MKVLHLLLDREHLTQRELAKMLGVDMTTVSRILRGKSRPSPVVARLIEQNFGLPIAQLMADVELEVNDAV